MDKNRAKAAAISKKRRRIRKKISGSSNRPRLSIYRSEKHIYGQLIDDEAGRTVLSCSSIAKDLKPGLSGKNAVEVAEAVGQALAEKAQAAGITQAVFDRGGRRYAGRVKALADGARSKGLQF